MSVGGDLDPVGAGVPQRAAGALCTAGRALVAHRELAGAVALAGGALAAAVALVHGVVADAGRIGAGLVAAGQALAVAVAAVALCWAWRRLRGLLPAGSAVATQRIVVHVDGEDWADAARHEAGHLAAMRAYGGKNLRGRIFRDGSGWADCDLPDDAPLEHVLAISYAGGMAEGSWHASGADLAMARRDLRPVPWLDRGAARARGERAAGKAIGWGATDRYRRKLEATGRW